MRATPIRIWAGLAGAALLLAAGVWIGHMTARRPSVEVEVSWEAATSAENAAIADSAKPAAKPSIVAAAAPSQVTAASGPADKALTAADALRSAGKLVEARAAYQALMSAYPESSAAAQAQTTLNATALDDYFKALTDANSVAYQVKAGDNLTRIAKQFGVTPGLVQAANFLKNDRIFPGQKLRVPKSRWSLLVDKSQNTLYLKADDAVVRSYRIATGKDQSTPEGTFKILNHLKNPTWYYEGKVIPPDSPDNPLGTRWLGFDKEGYGLHGTNKPDEIGQFATLGCVRMLNTDIEPLFELLPDGTEVTIIN